MKMKMAINKWQSVAKYNVNERKYNGAKRRRRIALNGVASQERNGVTAKERK